MRDILIKLINFYQKITLYSPKRCKFYPTCSEYAKESISKHGVLKGGGFALYRIVKCVPWAKNQIDLVK